MADVIYVVDDGLAIITNRIIGAGTEPKYIGWGTNATAATAADTGLGTAAAESRTTGTGTRVTTTETNDTYQVVGTIACASAGKTIAEVGLFDADTDGNMFLHGTFTGIPLNVGDSIQFTIQTVFDQA
jgi:hypothetical protein